MPAKFEIAYDTRPFTTQENQETVGTLFWEKHSDRRWDIIWSTLDSSDKYTIARMIEQAYQWGCRETKEQMQNDLKRLIGLAPFDRT